MSTKIQIGVASPKVVFGLEDNGVLILKSSEVSTGAVAINNALFLNEIKGNGNLLAWKVFYLDETSGSYLKLDLNSLVDGESTRVWTFKDNAGTTYIAITLTKATNAITNAITVAD